MSDPSNDLSGNDPVSDEAAPVPTDEPGQTPPSLVITKDLICLSCEYNLRGLRIDGRCPECNAEVAASLRGDFLRFANPKYVKKLAKGSSRICWSAAITLISAFAMVKEPGIAGFVLLVSGLLYLSGIWAIGTPEPDRPDTNNTARKLTRMAVILTPCHLILYAIATGIKAGGGSAACTVTIGVFICINSLLFFVSQFAFFVYLRKLALRIPDKKLARNTRIIMWGTVISMAMWVAITTIELTLRIKAAASLATSPGGPGPRAIRHTSYACFSVVTLIVFGLWWLLSLDKYRKHFKEQATLATGDWVDSPLLNELRPR